MKKLLSKLPIPKRSSKKDDRPSRITNETVAEHRERILAGGRRFKYPIQYAKHKLVINSIVIGVIAVALLIVLFWYQLYRAQNTSNLMYRLTQIIPVPVASVDGQSVRYSEYLRKYRSSIHFLQQQDSLNLRSEDGKRQNQFIKRQELNSAEMDAYAAKLARENDIRVSDEEVTEFINAEIEEKSISLQAYEQTVLQQFYDWSIDEYRQAVKAQLLKRRVNFAIDTQAKEKIDDIKSRVKDEKTFEAVAKSDSEDQSASSGGDSGPLPYDNEDPNNLIGVASGLEEGQISDTIQGTDGYYIVQLISKNDSSIRYRLIKVEVNQLQDQFAALEDDKRTEYIKIDDPEQQ